MTEALLGMQANFQRQGYEGPVFIELNGLPTVPLELCAPLTCMMAEVLALAPGATTLMQTVLELLLALQDEYYEVGLGTDGLTPLCALSCTLPHSFVVFCLCFPCLLLCLSLYSSASACLSTVTAPPIGFLPVACG
jgi:hypothetical protein